MSPIKEIPYLWFITAFRQTFKIHDPEYPSLDQKLRDDLESGEEQRIKRAYRSILSGEVSITAATRRFISEAFDPRSKQ